MSNIEPKGKRKKTALVSGALVTGGLVGAAILAAIYANNAGLINGSASQSAVNGENCALSQEARSALDDAARGDVAGVRILDEPVSVAGETFKGEDGAQTGIADWKGRFVLLNLWATWCAPCREEMPHLATLKQDMGNEKFDVVTVNVDLDESDKPKNFMNEIGVTNLPVYADNTMGIFNNFKKAGLAFGLPATLLIDGDGGVVGALNGPANWAGEDAKSLVAKALELDH